MRRKYHEAELSRRVVMFNFRKDLNTTTGKISISEDIKNLYYAAQFIFPLKSCRRATWKCNRYAGVSKSSEYILQKNETQLNENIYQTRVRFELILPRNSTHNME